MLVTIFELYRPYFKEEFEEAYELIYFQQKNRGYDEHFSYWHKGLFAEAMTGRRTFVTNINESSDEKGMREYMRKVGHTRIQTHLGYQHDRQNGKKNKPVSLFGVYRIGPEKKDKGWARQQAP
jgi:hypothetical protein